MAIGTSLNEANRALSLPSHANRNLALTVRETDTHSVAEKILVVSPTKKNLETASSSLNQRVSPILTPKREQILGVSLIFGVLIAFILSALGAYSMPAIVPVLLVFTAILGLCIFWHGKMKELSEQTVKIQEEKDCDAPHESYYSVETPSEAGDETEEKRVVVFKPSTAIEEPVSLKIEEITDSAEMPPLPSSGWTQTVGKAKAIGKGIAKVGLAAMIGLTYAIPITTIMNAVWKQSQNHVEY